jgi:multidrug resistance efflux pump
MEIAQSDAARAQAEGNAPGLAEASARRDEWQSKFAVAEHALQGTEIRAPAAGVIVTPHIETRVGQFLKRGTEFAEIADIRTAVVEVAIPEADALLLRKGQPVKVKLNAFPSRSFSGVVTRLGAEVREEGEDRFLTAEMEITNAAALIRSGMLGKAKINTGARPLGYALFRKPLRYLWAKIWPMLP